jgi:ABC-2 type transport system ATP-binding protein
VAVIELDGVTRWFGHLAAVHQISLHVEQGEIVGLLGHNGAGKTTMLRIINGLLPPDKGWVRVHGLDPVTEGARVRLCTGVLTEYPALEDYLTVVENLEVYAAINGVLGPVAGKRIDELMELLDLTDKRGVPTRQLSAGLKQRVALARALVHDPQLLLLDEPTTNMDPVAARRVRDLISDSSRRQGHTVLLSTHNLAEAEELCDRVAIVSNGRLLVMGTPSELRRRLGHVRGVSVTTRAGAAPAAVAVLGDEHAEVLRDDRIHINGSSNVPAIVARLVGEGFDIHAVEPDETSLEDLYVQLHVTGPPPLAELPAS